MRPSIPPLLADTALVEAVEVEVVWRSLLAGDFDLAAEDLLQLLLLLLFLLQPPPTGTLRNAPPRVQYLLQVLQKWRG